MSCLAKIRAAVARGLTDVNEISLQAGVSSQIIQKFRRTGLVALPYKNYSKNNPRIVKTDNVFPLPPPRPVYTMQEVADVLGTYYGDEHISLFAKQVGIKIAPQSKITAYQIRSLSEQGLCLREICATLDMSYMFVKEVAKKAKIMLTDKSPMLLTEDQVMNLQKKYEGREKESWLTRVFAGETLEAIAEPEGITRELIRQRLQSHGYLYDYWMMLRTEKTGNSVSARELQQNRQNMLSTLCARMGNQFASDKNTWAEKKALHYMLNRQERDNPKAPLYSYNSILTLFQAYEQARKKGDKVSFKILGKRAGINSTSYVGRILAKAGEHSLQWSRKTHFHRLSTKEKATLGKVWRTSPHLLGTDIAYFTGHTPNVIPSNARRASEPLLWYSHGYQKGTSPIGYALASQIYEARDAGFTLPETVEYIGKPLPLIRKVISERATIAPQIVQVLQTLYPEQNPTKPYLNHYQFGRIITPKVSKRRKLLSSI